MAKLDPLEIYQAARRAGFSRDSAVTWTAIALAESGGNPDAHATKGENSRGLWQINLNAHSARWGGQNLYDPDVNARAAYEISGHGTNKQPWTVTHERNRNTPRDYRRYLDEAQAAAQQDGGATTTRAFSFAGGGAAGGGGVDDSGLSQPLDDAKLTDTWGASRSGGRHHMGIDIFKPKGTPIRAVASGKVVQGFHNDLGGNVVRIQGDDGRYYYYAHLKDDSIPLKVGDHVGRGQFIGEVGNTGDARTTPPHLHLQVKDNGDWVNPYDFLQGVPDFDESMPGGQAGGMNFAMDRGSPPSLADADSDGLTDTFEQLLGTDPNLGDTDKDGLSDAYETGVAHTDPLAADTDLDGIGDAAEVARGTDAGKAPIPEAARAAGFGGLATMDSDNDGLSDAFEQKIGTDPMKADSDLDGLSDSQEYARGSDPLKIDSDGDGLTDGFEWTAGTLEPATQGGMGQTAFGAAPGMGTGLGDGLGDPGGLGADPMGDGLPDDGTMPDAGDGHVH